MEVSLWSPSDLVLLSLNTNLAKIYRLIPSDAHGDQLPPCGSMEFKIMPVDGTIEPSMTRHVERQSAWTTGAPEGVSYTPSLDSSNSGSAVSTLFDNDSDWVAESLPSSVASNDVRNEYIVSIPAKDSANSSIYA
jgi:hypothetical protein